MVKESLVKHIDKSHMLAENITDDLLANGIIVPPCKVGQTVYVKWKLHRKSNYGIYPAKVYALRWDEKKNNFRVCVEGVFEISAYGGKYSHYYNGTFAWDSVSKTVFLTREEAEKALAEREGK
ncbi:MAG: hypothetical protein J6W31_05850 [Clostridia bacterium]|nr:hypothetical protein [Clostridia bacterium]